MGKGFPLTPFEIGRRRAQPPRIIAKAAQTVVASRTQQTAHATPRVTVVDRERHEDALSYQAFRSSANSTQAVLHGQKGVVSLQSHAVPTAQVMTPLVGGVRGGSQTESEAVRVLGIAQSPITFGLAQILDAAVGCITVAKAEIPRHRWPLHQQPNNPVNRYPFVVQRDKAPPHPIVHMPMTSHVTGSNGRFLRRLTPSERLWDRAIVGKQPRSGFKVNFHYGILARHVVGV
jgi:hypothetical protein